MIVKYLRSSLNLYPSKFLYTYRSDFNKSKKQLTKFAPKLQLGESFEQLKAFYLQNKRTMTAQNIQQFCKGLSRILKKQKFNLNKNNIQFFQILTQQIQKTQKNSISLSNLQTFLQLNVVLMQNYSYSLSFDFLQQLFQSEHITEQISKTSLKKLSILFCKICYIGIRPTLQLISIIIQKMQKLNESLEIKTENITQSDIFVTLLNLLKGIYVGVLNTFQCSKLIQNIIKTFQQTWEKIQKTTLFYILYYLDNPTILKYVFFKDKNVQIKLNKLALQNIESLNFKQCNQLLENQKPFYGEFQIQVHNQILNVCMKSINEQGDSKIYLSVLLQYLIKLGEKDIIMPEKYCEQFFKFLMKTITIKNHFYVANFLAQMIESGLLKNQCYYKMLYDMVMNKKELPWLMKILRQLNNRKYDISQVFPTSVKNASRNIDTYFIYAAVLVKQIPQKTPEIENWQRILTNKIQNFSQIQLEHMMKINNPIMVDFMSYYGRLFQKRIQAKFIKQCDKQGYKFIVLYFSKDRQNELFKNMSYQKKIMLIDFLALILNCINEKKRAKYMLISFLKILIKEFDQNKKLDAKSKIFRVLTSQKIVKFINPKHQQITILYSQIIRKIFHSKDQDLISKIIYFYSSNHMYYYNKTSTFFQLLHSISETQNFQNSLSFLQRHLIHFNLLTSKTFQKVSKQISEIYFQSFFGKVTNFVQFHKKLSFEEISLLFKMKEITFQRVAQFLTKFNLIKSEQSENILQFMVVTKFMTINNMRIETINIMALIENMKKLVKQGYQRENLINVVSKLVDEFSHPSVQSRLFLQDQLYLLSQATKLQIKLNLPFQVIEKLTSNLDKVSYCQQVLRQSQFIFNQNKWKISPTLKAAFQQRKEYP